MQKRINADVLERGDIVLTTSPAKESAQIRFWTMSDISHAMICVSGYSVMDSTGDGVHARNIQKMWYPENCAIYVLRLKRPITSDQLDGVIAYVRANTGTSYSLSEAVAAIAPPPIRGTQKQFCSRLVARAYESVGIRLVKNPEFCTPEDIKKSDLLRHVDNPSLAVSDEEIKSLEAQGDATAGMRNVTNAFLDMAREKCGDIQCINDVARAVIADSRLDAHMSEALRKSGYLDYWKRELENYPWRYDPVVMVQMYHSLDDKTELLAYCQYTLDDEEERGFEHWKESDKAIRQINDKFPREFLSLLATLYFNLNFSHHQRIVAAKTLISVYGAASK